MRTLRSTCIATALLGLAFAGGAQAADDASVIRLSPAEIARIQAEADARATAAPATPDRAPRRIHGEIGASIEPKPGVLLVWNNALPDGTPNEATLHAGTPVISGEKYVLTKWYRTRKWT